MNIDNVPVKYSPTNGYLAYPRYDVNDVAIVSPSGTKDFKILGTVTEGVYASYVSPLQWSPDGESCWP